MHLCNFNCFLQLWGKVPTRGQGLGPGISEKGRPSILVTFCFFLPIHKRKPRPSGRASKMKLGGPSNNLQKHWNQSPNVIAQDEMVKNSWGLYSVGITKQGLRQIWGRTCSCFTKNQFGSDPIPTSHKVQCPSDDGLLGISPNPKPVLICCLLKNTFVPCRQKTSVEMWDRPTSWNSSNMEMVWFYCLSLVDLTVNPNKRKKSKTMSF